MKNILLFLFIISSFTSAAQEQTFDITSYTAPKNWKKEQTDNGVQFSKEDAAKGTYCLITLYKAVPGTTDAKGNFDMAWASLVKEMVTVSAAPEMQPPATENGWEAQSGFAPFESDGNKGIAILVTSSGFEKMVNVIVLTNTDVYENEMTAFFESVSFKKIETKSQQVTVNNNNNISFIGSWGKSNSVSQANNRFGTYSYNKQQYTFNSNGTYSFRGKNYSEQYDETLLIKESGTYSVSGNNLTINPQSSVIEAWSKSNGSDNYNKLKSSQKRTLEKTTYQFSIQENNLVLQTAKETIRDGRFSSGNSYSYGPPGTFTAIKLPGE